MAITRSYKVGDELPPLTKTMTQEAINAFEKSGGAKGPSQFTDLETAKSTLGTGSTVASGRMSLTFTIEMLRRYFGADVYNAGGMVDMRFLRPLRPGDTVTFNGKITGTNKEADGTRVTVEISATNQKGAVTAAGMGACIVPSGYLPADE
jgi:3-hydroxybutyryl-CoA dehydratase